MGNQTHRGGFAIGSRHGNHWDTPVFTIREHLLDHGFTNIASFAKRGAQVHTQSGCSIDFDDAAVLLLKGTQNGFTNNVHTANIQAHHLSSQDGTGSHFRVHIISDIGRRTTRRQIGVVAHDDAHAFWRNTAFIQVLFLQASQGNFIDTDTR